MTRIKEVMQQQLLQWQEPIKAHKVYKSENCQIVTITGHFGAKTLEQDDTLAQLLAIGVSQLLFSSCGMIFHPDYRDRDCPSIPSNNLWKLISLATEVPSDSLNLQALLLVICRNGIYLYVMNSTAKVSNRQFNNIVPKCVAEHVNWQWCSAG